MSPMLQLVCLVKMLSFGWRRGQYYGYVPEQRKSAMLVVIKLPIGCLGVVLLDVDDTSAVCEAEYRKLTPCRAHVLTAMPPTPCQIGGKADGLHRGHECKINEFWELTLVV